MTIELIPEIFQKLSQQVDSARESLQKLFDDEYGSILNEHIKEKAELAFKIDVISKQNLELQTKLDSERIEKKEIEHELAVLQKLSSEYFIKVEKEITESIGSGYIYYGIPNLQKKIEEAIFDATNFFNKNCPYCGSSLYQGHVRTKIEIDHFIPISKGGQNFPWNILPICKDCNRKKRNKMPSEFLEKKTFENCLNYLNDVKKRFSADIDCIGTFEIIKKLIYDHLDSLHDKNSAYKILEQIAELVHPGIKSVLKEPFSSKTDEFRCLSAILETQVKVYNDNNNKKIIDLIKVMSKMTVIVDSDNVHMTLKKHGIKIVKDGFLIANKHPELSKKLENTPWANNWSHMLIRLPGAIKFDATRFCRILSRAVMLPFSYIDNVNSSVKR